MITLIIVAAIFVIMGVVILLGKGDNLIAGYNTASQKERAQYNIKRLRGLIGGLLIVLAPMLFLLHGETMAATGSFVALTILLCIIVAAFGYTYFKEKWTR